jgi:hypothetical protein
MRTITTSLGFAGVALLLAHPASAQGRWELLGSRSVAFNVERDTVAARREGLFTMLRLCVNNNAVHFRNVLVVFENGERQNVAVNRNLRPGACSPNLDLRGTARRIDHVELVYNTIPGFGGRAEVSVYGYHPVGAVAPRAGRWDTIGVRNVGFHIDRDTVSGQGEGRFVAIRLCIARNAVHFRDLKVTFGNGQVQDIPVQSRIRPGNCTPALDLMGGARRIREIAMLYNTVPNFQGQAQVTVQGLHPAGNFVPPRGATPTPGK